MVVGVAVILEGQSAVADVIQILEPLKIRHGDTTSIEEEVRQDKDTLLLQDLVSLHGCGAVGSFSDDLGVDLVSVLLGDDTLDGAGGQNVALFV